MDPGRYVGLSIMLIYNSDTNPSSLLKGEGRIQTNDTSNTIFLFYYDFVFCYFPFQFKSPYDVILDYLFYHDFIGFSVEVVPLTSGR